MEEGAKQAVKKFTYMGNLRFTDLNEATRTYTFPGQEEVTIYGVIKLHVSDNGHRLYTESGKSYYIPFGWISLMWIPEEGQPNFEL